MNRKVQILIIFLLFVLLVLLRGIFDGFVYDPLIHYFKQDYLNTQFPDIETFKYVVYLVLRYVVNSIVSLAIIYLFYKNVSYVKFALKFYALMFVILCFILILDLNYNFFNTYMVVFYTRRFLIHPVFLIVLLPAFYYQKIQYLSSKK